MIETLIGIRRLRAEIPGVQFLSGRIVVVPASNDGTKLQMLRADGSLRIKFMVSTPAINAYGFRIEPTAYTETLRDFKKRPRMHVHHDWSQPAGRWDIDQQITEDGLLLDGWITSARPDIQQMVLDGTLEEASVVVLPLAERREDGDVPVYTKVKLYAADIVSLGADPNTWGEVVGRMAQQHSIEKAATAGALRAACGALSEFGGMVQERDARTRRMATFVEALTKGAVQ